jgi:hypothetical protein
MRKGVGEVALPRRVSPGARARRALLADVLAALALGAVALSLAAGLGVVGVLALPLLVVGLLWIGVERGIARRRSVRGRLKTAAADADQAPSPPAR